MATYFVSLTGSDSAAGTQAAPFRTLTKGISMLGGAGDILYIRGGTYSGERMLIQYKNGSAGNPIIIQNYPGEIVILDLQNVRYGGEWEGAVHINNCSYLTVKGNNAGSQKGFQVRWANQRGFCVYTIGGNSGFDGCHAEYSLHNGFMIDYGADCFITNCDATENARDNNGSQTGNTIYTNPNGVEWSGGISAGTFGNPVTRPVIRGCRSWRNRGEGIGMFGLQFGGTIEDCISWDNYSVNIYPDSCTGVTVQRNICYQTANSYLRSWGSGQTPYLDGILTANEQAGKECKDMLIINNLVRDGKIKVVAWAMGGASTVISNILCAHNTTNAVEVGPGPQTNGTYIGANYTGSVAGGSDPSLPSYYHPSSPVSIARRATILQDYYKNNRSDPTVTGAIEQGSSPSFGPLPAPWTSGDIGTVGTAGDAGYLSGVYRVRGAGALYGNFATSDAHHFAYRQLAGDFVVVCRIATTDNPNSGARFGLSVRSALTANSPAYAVVVDTAGTLHFLFRPSTGGVLNDQTVSTTDRYLRVTRSGDDMVFERSANGSTWTYVDNDSVAGWGSSLYVGLAVDSGTTGALATGTFDNVSVTVSLPSPWVGADIGSPPTAGSDVYTGTAFEITGSGADIWGTADQFRFVYQSVNGDFAFRCQVASPATGILWSKYGLMARGALTAGAQHAMISRGPLDGNRLETNHRLTTNGATTNTGVAEGVAAPYMMLTRSGNTFTRYYSTTGEDDSWIKLGGDQVIAMPGSVYVGMIVCPQTSTAATATFTDPTFDALSSVATADISFELVGVADVLQIVEATGTMVVDFTLTGISDASAFSYVDATATATAGFVLDGIAEVIGGQSGGGDTTPTGTELPPFVGYSNQIDSATLSGSGWNASYPLSNLKSRHLKRKARSTSASSAQFDVNLGSTMPIGMIALIATNLSAAAQVRIIGSHYSDFSSSELDTGYITHYSGADYALSWPNVSARYWRVSVTDPTNPDGYVAIGRCFIGPRFVPRYPISFGHSLGVESDSQVQRSMGGVEYFDERTNRRVFKAKWQYLTTGEAITQWFRITRAHDVTREVYLIVDPTADQQDRNFLGRLRTLGPIEAPDVKRHETAIEIAELL